MKKDGPGPVMVSGTLSPAMHILKSHNMYSSLLSAGQRVSLTITGPGPSFCLSTPASAFIVFTSTSVIIPSVSSYCPITASTVATATSAAFPFASKTAMASSPTTCRHTDTPLQQGHLCRNFDIVHFTRHAKPTWRGKVW